MSAIIIDGKARGLALRTDVAAGVADFVAAHGRAPGLTVVLVGQDPASAVYVRMKGAATREAGMVSGEHVLPSDTSEAALLALVAALNADPAVDGILVQLPLPRHIDTDRVLAAIDPAKDVDGFHPVNVGRLSAGLDALVPCTPAGCLLLITEALGDIAGKEALVIGRSNIVGKPMAALLLGQSATVTIAHSRTRDLAAHVGGAEIVVAAVGVPGLVKGEWIRPGACVIDVGTNRVTGADGKARLVGDVDFDSARTRAGWITPVPGGVGPMTIAGLLANTLKAARARASAA
ncbi:bifunctional methylenetetrahydrofolate dehydrogenase/methenyltetrahydrofolate cyclohydrolase FolD [Polymorphobacter fuscus]|uniref:Bifunctional protein FolD n=1 Tax=Sandarakinorhabdus fusca TaxID=1439888 RepID=A0A7C9KJL6_9SPHN|nr:bifunctional methylenetetrahydrofolate dehydrogenase/methenyltetrahydrofolate cyclohydrolase FolD [Polymorphobacter fuscus]KAB7644828.1 bifunctional methylenetetrahydrofolate dehydrogenase/methenyltetrahydrofolate cyclohydrolase FolD [Polymorphobacter fuscus]MQT18101.1 bifunctional methylenetetrahydrofolate dehydrogenase/methenyltetrahydrofolate cyclohydrolase FolD [Polymorphobacter fuscus]NJC09419.1 methylenetetrahydrofolate dehydrogenase (NADP+)/methenyltetrahydrofolate cyclohydrolase [Poly